jgi:hypothetical protein
VQASTALACSTHDEIQVSSRHIRHHASNCAPCQPRPQPTCVNSQQCPLGCLAVPALAGQLWGLGGLGWQQQRQRQQSRCCSRSRSPFETHLKLVLSRALDFQCWLRFAMPRHTTTQHSSWRIHNTCAPITPHLVCSHAAERAGAVAAQALQQLPARVLRACRGVMLARVLHAAGEKSEAVTCSPVLWAACVGITRAVRPQAVAGNALVEHCA